jgi:hypothetical protein
MKITLIIFILLFACMSVVFSQLKPIDFIGAWETGTEIKKVKIVTRDFFSTALYKEKEFIGTYGGKWKLEGNVLTETLEFNSIKPEAVGTETRSQVKLQSQKLILETDKNSSEEWKMIDDGKPGQLAGAWLITGRMTNGSLNKMTPGARRTMKILSGTRFQWIAYNVDTKEFSGTGGGTYTTENGKYTENILFFSRDNNRIGASLQFDFSLEDGNWRHKGLSSKGEPIDEVWTKREKIGL